MIYCTGDTHGQIIDRFSYKHYSELRDLTDKDYMFIAGDFGAIWDWTGNNASDKHMLEFLNEKPWITIVVLGNHECYPLYEEMPVITPDFLYKGEVRQCVYAGQVFNHIFVIDNTAWLKLEGKNILCIAGAVSHDKIYRTEGKSWWPQEEINQEFCDKIVMNDDGSVISDHFDLIITHDAPSQIGEWYTTMGVFSSTDGQYYLNRLRRTLDFDKWYHGHFHFDKQWPARHYNFYTQQNVENIDTRLTCLYENIVQIG